MSNDTEITRLRGVIIQIDETLANVVGGVHHQKIAEARRIAQLGLDPASNVDVEVKRPPSGRLCQKCNVEMYYNSPNTILASYPPQMSVQCPECKKIDYIRI